MTDPFSGADFRDDDDDDDNYLYFSGLLFFSCLYMAAYRLLSAALPRRIRDAFAVTFSMRLVGSLQSIAACVVGSYIIVKCQKDIMKDRCWITNAFAKFGTAYFFIDLIAMYLSYLEQKRGREMGKKETNLISADALLLHRRDLKEFLSKNKLMTFHHLVLPLVFGPCLVMRDVNADFFVGSLYLIEASSPFVNLRAVLRSLEYHNTRLYVVNGVVMMLVFFLCRIAIFPFLYRAYAEYKDMNVFEVPGALPIKCNVGCLILLSMQIYWFLLMVRGLLKIMNSRLAF